MKEQMFLLLVMIMVGCSQAMWICPSHSPVPTIENVRFGRRMIGDEDKLGCLSIPIDHHQLAFFLKLELGNPPFSTEMISAYEMKFFPGFYVVVAHRSALTELEQQSIGNSYQLIVPPSMLPKNIPKVTAKFLKNAEKDEIISRLDGVEYYSEMEKITGEKEFQVGGSSEQISTRYTGTADNNLVANYLLQRLTQLGYSAFFQTFRYNGNQVQNIIAIKRGSSSEIVVVGAHYDSTSQSPTTSAPGCVDNGSGTEGVMQIAKAFSNSTLSKTVHFVLFGVEEQGLIGSNYYVDNLASNGYNVVFSLIMDMIGYSNQYYGVRLETSNTEENRALLDLTTANLNSYAPELSVVRNYFPFGSDHVPFIQNDIPCYLAIERDGTDYVGYHRTTDRVNYLSVEQSIDILKGIAGTLYDIAS